MLTSNYYAEFVRARITELRIARGVTEHRMSMDLGKCGSYIRSITSGRALPSLGELFNICIYFDITPSGFFAPLENTDTTFSKLCKRLQTWSNEDLEKINTFASLLGK